MKRSTFLSLASLAPVAALMPRKAEAEIAPAPESANPPLVLPENHFTASFHVNGVKVVLHRPGPRKTPFGDDYEVTTHTIGASWKSKDGEKWGFFIDTDMANEARHLSMMLNHCAPVAFAGLLPLESMYILQRGMLGERMSTAAFEAMCATLAGA